MSRAINTWQPRARCPASRNAVCFSLPCLDGPCPACLITCPAEPYHGSALPYFAPTGSVLPCTLGLVLLIPCPPMLCYASCPMSYGLLWSSIPCPILPALLCYALGYPVLLRFSMPSPILPCPALLCYALSYFSLPSFALLYPATYCPD